MRGEWRLAVDLSGWDVALLGGDQREAVLGRALAEAGARVIAVGFLRPFDHPRIERSMRAVEAVSGAAAVIAPMSSTDDAGVIKAVEDTQISLVLDDALFRAMRPGTPLFIGIARPVVQNYARQHGIRVVQMAEADPIAILNSIPTAEGALQLAMERLPITLHGCEAAVIGFGRCGMTLARMLQGIGAHTCVLARSAAQLARAQEMRFTTAPWSHMAEVLATSDVIFNTVPTRVLDRPVLERLRQQCLIIDIASEPGGTDFAAARELGIEAYLELGLPGRVAPVTAGRILASTIPPMLAEILDDGR